MDNSTNPSDIKPTGQLAAALAKAQREIEPALRESVNPFFNSRYADLSAVWRVIREPLTRNGIAVVQAPVQTDGETVSIRTVLMHESGESVEGILTMKPKDTSPQSIGSCITYARRYALMSMVGVSPEDDDAEAAQAGRTAEMVAGRGRRAGSPTRAEKAPEAKPTPPGWDEFIRACNEKARTDLAGRRLAPADYHQIAQSIMSIVGQDKLGDTTEARCLAAAKWLREHGQLKTVFDDAGAEIAVEPRPSQAA